MSTPYLFRFYIDDPDPESVMFGCTAASLQDAERQARVARYKKFTLYEQRELEPFERPESALERLVGHPFLGPEWIPFASVVAHITDGMTAGDLWVIQTLGAAYRYSSDLSPYVQAIVEGDGSLHVEVAGGALDSPTRPEQFAQLELLGWTAPTGETELAGEGRLPNSYRIFDPPWNGQQVAEAFLEALTMAFGITADDFFSFGEGRADLVAGLNLLERVEDGIVFRLPPKPEASAEDHSAEPVTPARSVDESSQRVPADEENGAEPRGTLSDSSEDAEALLVDVFEHEGLDLPYLPDSLPRPLIAVDAANFATEHALFEPDLLYLFRMPMAELAKGEWEPRAQFGFAGHGMNSYAWTYLLVDRGVAILGQVGRGVLCPNPERTKTQWSALMNGARRLHSMATERGQKSADELFVVVWNTLRGITGWRWLSREDLPERPDLELVEWKRNADTDPVTSADAFFAAAATAYSKHRGRDHLGADPGLEPVSVADVGGNQYAGELSRTTAGGESSEGNEPRVSHFTAGAVTVEILEGSHPIKAVPPSQWHGDRLERPARAILANLKADDGLRAQVSLVRWDDSDEVSLGYAELFAGPSDYERLEDAGAMSPKLLGDRMVARIRALKYGPAGRATGAAVDWSQIDEWASCNAQEKLAELGAIRTGAYGVLLPSASRFKSEPAIEVSIDNPAPLFAVYALTRVVPIMTGHGKRTVDGPNS